MLSLLAESNTSTLIVLTKADKCHNDWPVKCAELAQSIREEMLRLERSLDNKWKAGIGWDSNVLITAANMEVTRSLGDGAGVGAARAAILELAGFKVDGNVEQSPEAAAYTGPVVAFEDIPWKS